MIGAVMAGIKTVTDVFKSSVIPVEIGGDDQVAMVKPPTGPIDFLFTIVTRALRPGLVLLVLWMFYWFAIAPDLASKWVSVVKQIPDQMWTAIMIILTSIGLSKVVRDIKNPHDGPTMIVKTGTPGDGATHPTVEVDVTPDPVAPDDPPKNPTLAAWRAAQNANP